MKNIRILVLSMVSFCIMAISCKKDENQNFSTLVKSAAAVQFDGVPSSLIVREDTADVVATITVSLSEPQIVEVHVPITQISGDAELGSDYDLSTTELVFPPYTTGPQTFTVTILDDDIAEGDETFSLQIGEESNATITPAVMDVKIVNATNLDLNMTFDWTKNYLLHYASSTNEDTTVNALTLVDYDFFVFDSLGSLGDGSGNDMGYYDAAAQGRGSKEALTLTVPADTGVFVVSAYLYTNIFNLIGYGALLLPQGPLQVTTTFDRKGVLDPVKLVQDKDLAYTTETPDAENDGIDNFNDLFKIVAKEDMFIIYRLDGSVFANARKAHHTSANYHKYKSGVPFFKWR